MQGGVQQLLPTGPVMVACQQNPARQKGRVSETPHKVSNSTPGAPPDTSAAQEPPDSQETCAQCSLLMVYH